MKRFRIIFPVPQKLRSFNKEAAIDSLRNVLAVLGLGLLIGDFATMQPLYVGPAAAILLAVWYADYLRHDLPSATSITEVGADVPDTDQPMMASVKQLEKAS